MGKKKTLKHFEDLRKMAYGGALAVKSTDLLRHARNPTALGGDVSGFVGIGIPRAMSEVAAKPLGMMYDRKKKKRKRKRR